MFGIPKLALKFCMRNAIGISLAQCYKKSRFLSGFIHIGNICYCLMPVISISKTKSELGGIGPRP